jgi:hypothetical protein
MLEGLARVPTFLFFAYAVDISRWAMYTTTFGIGKK